MKKQYLFLILILIILYALFLIWSFKYKEYKINSHIEYITNLNLEIRNTIEEGNKIIEYKSSNAYKNKILKEQQWYKSSWEEVVYLTSEQVYNTYTSEIKDSITELTIEKIDNPKNKTDGMTIFQKWIYFIFKKDLRI